MDDSFSWFSQLFLGGRDPDGGSSQERRMKIYPALLRNFRCREH